MIRAVPKDNPGEYATAFAESPGREPGVRASISIAVS